ncbi:MAG TPA: outer membrane beta-barrel protein [Xanthobacteraceae bacterium]|jgi:outer membrane immunogenic protein
MKVMRLCLAAMALAAAILPAAAADMPVETYYQPRPAIVVFRWTGVHVGLHAGGGFGTTDETPVPFALGLSPSPTPCPTTVLIPLTCGGISPSPVDVSVSGWLAGGQVGADYQIENWVLGVEGQASWTNIKGSTTCGGVGFPAAAMIVSGSCTAKLDSLGTAALRAGYAFDRLLVYGKGGAAWTNDNYQVKLTTALPTNLLFSGNELRWGWMVGAGLEYAFTDSWTAKIEYNYMDLGAIAPRLQEAYSSVFLDTNIREKMNVVKIGVNYRLGPTPILVR